MDVGELRDTLIQAANFNALNSAPGDVSVAPGDNEDFANACRAHAESARALSEAVMMLEPVHDPGEAARELAAREKDMRDEAVSFLMVDVYGAAGAALTHSERERIPWRELSAKLHQRLGGNFEPGTPAHELSVDAKRVLYGIMSSPMRPAPQDWAQARVVAAHAELRAFAGVTDQL